MNLVLGAKGDSTNLLRLLKIILLQLKCRDVDGGGGRHSLSMDPYSLETCFGQVQTFYQQRQEEEGSSDLHFH